MMSGFVKIDNYVDDRIRNAKRRLKTKTRAATNSAKIIELIHEKGRMAELEDIRRFLDNLFGREEK